MHEKHPHRAKEQSARHIMRHVFIHEMSLRTAHQLGRPDPRPGAERPKGHGDGF